MVIPLTTLVAVVIGGLMTLASNYLLKKREIRLQLAQNLMKKKIDAYDELLSHVRFGNLLAASESGDGSLVKYPVIFQDENGFEEWECKFIITVRRVFHLIDADTYEACFAFQNYLLNLDKLTGGLKGTTAIKRITPELGAKLLPDFKMYIGRIENCCYHFYRKGIYSLRINPPDLRNTDKSSEIIFIELKSTQLWQLQDNLR